MRARRWGALKIAALGVAAVMSVVMAGCAAVANKKAEDSPIELAKSLLLHAVPLGGVAVQALVGVGGVEDRGSYRYHTNLFCQTSSQGLEFIRTHMGQLCTVKGGRFDGQFCLRGQGIDEVLFSAVVQPHGSGCHRLHTTEAVHVGSPDYLQFLVSQGFETAQVKASKREAEAAAAADIRRRAQAEQQARLAREKARLEVELPQMRKRGAQVCQVSSSNGFTYRGYVEDFSDEKLKISVADVFHPGMPGVRPGGFTQHTLWDFPIRWRLC